MYLRVVKSVGRTGFKTLTPQFVAIIELIFRWRCARQPDDIPYGY